MMESNFNHAKKIIKEYIELLSYDPWITIKKLMDKKGVTQKELASLLKLTDRSIRNYLSNKTKLSKDFLCGLCCILELPFMVSLELFKISGLELTLLGDNLFYFELLKTKEKYTIKKNLLRLKHKKV